jgi:DNA-binding NarL/FixJ family response regulator
MLSQGKAMSAIRVVLADDHALVRAGFRALLEQLSDVTVVADAGDGREALRLVGEHRPDVLLTDISMPGLNGLELVGRIRRDYPGVRVLILSMHGSEEYVLQALRSGAAGYLLKDAATTELEVAVKAVARGETYLSPAVSRHVVAGLVHRGSDGGSRESLTPRQREILRLIAGGKTTKEIARALNISVKTVETHRMQLMERLDIHDIAGLVRYALRIGLVAADE